jgi:hypothetical protein
MCCKKCFDATLFHTIVMFSGLHVYMMYSRVLLFWGCLKSKVDSTRPMIMDYFKQRIWDRISETLE